MILGYTNTEIVKKAVENQSYMTDGVVQYNYVTGKVYGGAFTTGTIENPENPVIEIFRLPQGERGEIDCNCNECPFRYEDAQYPSWETLYPETREECCVEAYADDGFEEDFENNFKELVEEEIRDIINTHIGDELSKLNKIYLKYYELFENQQRYYQKYFNEDFEMDVIDELVDDALEDGFTLIDPLDWLDSKIYFVHLKFDVCADYDVSLSNSQKELAKDVAMKLLENDLDGALELLQ